MRTSNKILLGGFLFLILLVTGLHVTIYAKYKSGHYTIYQPGKIRQPSLQSFPGVSVVSIHDIGADIEFGDVAAMEKDGKKFARYVQHGDSLIITMPDDGRGFGDRPRVKLILPYNVTVIAQDASLIFENGKGNTNTSPIVFLDNSQAIFGFPGRQMQLGHLKLTASDSSVVAFDGSINMNHLDVALQTSSLEYHDGEIGQISIATDAISELKMQAKHLLKAKFTPSPNNP